MVDAYICLGVFVLACAYTYYMYKHLNRSRTEYQFAVDEYEKEFEKIKGDLYAVIALHDKLIIDRRLYKLGDKGLSYPKSVYVSVMASKWSSYVDGIFDERYSCMNPDVAKRYIASQYDFMSPDMITLERKGYHIYVYVDGKSIGKYKLLSCNSTLYIKNDKDGTIQV